jgi:hypothetical protein
MERGDGGVRGFGAVVLALALVALVGSGAASATQACKRVEGGGDGKCPGAQSEKELAKGQSFRATSTDLVLTSPTTDVACAGSSLRVRMTSPNGIKLLRGKVPALTFSGCKTSGGTPCTTSVANLPYETVLQKRDILFFDPAGVVIGLNCGLLISCEFVAREQLLEAAGNLLVASGERPLARKGAFCPIAPRLDASYRALPGFTFVP